MKKRELKKVPKGKIGRVDTNGVRLEAHEYNTIYYLACFGLNIEVLIPTNTPKVHNADFLLLGSIWEAKSPTGNGNSSIARQFHKASKQANKLVLDLRRIRMGVEKSEKESLARFEKAKNIRHLLLITKDGRVLDVSK